MEEHVGGSDRNAVELPRDSVIVQTQRQMGRDVRRAHYRAAGTRQNVFTPIQDGEIAFRCVSYTRSPPFLHAIL